MLFQGTYDFPPTVCMPALKAKAAALYELSSRLKPDTSEWSDYCFAESALQKFSSTLPSIPDPMGNASPFNYDYFAIQTIVYTSYIHMQQGVFFDERALKAANSIVRLLQQLCEMDYQYLDPIMSVSATLYLFQLLHIDENLLLQACWNSASKIFTRVLTNIDTMGSDTEDITNLALVSNEGLDVLLNAMKSLGAFSTLSSMSPFFLLQRLTLNVSLLGDLALKVEQSRNRSRLL